MRSAARCAVDIALIAALAVGSAGLAGCGTTTGHPVMTPLGQHVRRIGCTPPRLPGTTVHVTLGDMGSMMAGRSYGRMMLRALPATVPAGRISFEVANMGRRIHEMLVLPLAAGRTAGSRTPVGTGTGTGTINEADSLGEASATCVGGEGDGIHSGTAGWMTLTLAPGRYELVCNRPHHYAAGMYEAFTVS